ncbi:hypothetical protein PHYPSEUDO_000830 [Phytophthora pseudosyringae]|uniref:Uncharacterized protein n=1 Tax=Phytophthora pseudosyringae TaxID=221518 RepID=A0A8T1WE71_9STRA|nr:hypothetical protein PHYPSEUDO_000830 [Phytophthora pseudosyringae]
MPRDANAPECTASDASTDSSQSVKKRKPTYLVRKAEASALEEEVRRLQAQVAVLQTQGMPAGAALAADPALQQSTATWKVLTESVKNQQLGVAAAQSLMTECSRTQFSHPLHTRIRLQTDWGERRATLVAIREQKLTNAYDYVMARSLHAADGPGQNSSEQFETDDGDVCNVGNTVVRFPGVQSLEQVFEALCFYLTNMEISISERLGHITVREDYDMIEGSAYNARIVSSDDNGVSTESNTIVFMQLVGRGDPRFGGEPCVVVASDCVDEDELYPYRPSEHARKDISGAIVMTTSREPKHALAATGEGFEGDELVVTMRRAGYLKLHRPEFPVSPLAQQELEAGIADWGPVMIKAMREILYART